MSELDMIAAVRDFSFWLIFAFLYLRERQRVQQLSDERVGDLKRWIDALTAIQMAQRGRLVLSDEDDLRDKHRGSGD